MESELSLPSSLSSSTSSTWFHEKHQYKWYEKLAINIIKMGPIPYHIAFIMDGNRRYAKSENIKKIDGHSRGFIKLTECLKWCLDCGVKEITTFAFSIENFKRSEDEVKQLMNLAKEKFYNLLDEENLLHEKGIKIKIIGNLSLIPDNELKQLMAKLMLKTENNNKLFLNIAFAYTSHDEIKNSLQHIIENSDELEPNDINDTLIRYCLYTKDSPDPDLLIRSSGEKRISDFLMWQISATVLYFTKTYWPAITLWHFLAALFTYQRSVTSLWFFKKHSNCDKIKNSSSTTVDILPERVQNFLRKIDARQHDNLVNLANAKGD